MASTDTPATLSDTLDTHRLAWAAGIVDGEGSIVLQKHKTRGYWALSVTVGNTDPRMLTILRDLFGGSISRYQPAGPRKPIWKWNVASRKAEHCLRQVLPWLVTKREQAELGLRSRELLTPRGQKWRPPALEDGNRWIERRLKELKLEHGDQWIEAPA
jgi:hypothetical protein